MFFVWFGVFVLLVCFFCLCLVLVSGLVQVLMHPSGRGRIFS